MWGKKQETRSVSRAPLCEVAHSYTQLQLHTVLYELHTSEEGWGAGGREKMVGICGCRKPPEKMALE